MGRLLKLTPILTLCALLAACSIASDLHDGVSTVGQDIGKSLDKLGGGDADATAGNKGAPKEVRQLEAILAVPTPDRDRKAVALIEKYPHVTHPGLTDYLVAKAAYMPPLVLYELAGRTYPFDRWKGVFWYYVAKVRLLYELSRCTDRSVMSELQDAEDLVYGLKIQIRLFPHVAYATGLAALDWEKKTEFHEPTPLPACLGGGDAVSAFGDVKLRAKKDKSGRITLVGADDLMVDPTRWIRPAKEEETLLEVARRRVGREVSQLANKSGSLPAAWDD